MLPATYLYIIMRSDSRSPTIIRHSPDFSAFPPTSSARTAHRFWKPKTFHAGVMARKRKSIIRSIVSKWWLVNGETLENVQLPVEAHRTFSDSEPMSLLSRM